MIAVLFLVAAVASSAYGIYSAYYKNLPVRIAVVSMDDPDTVALQAIAGTLATSARRTRFQFVVTGSVAASLKAVTQREADVASVRADVPLPAGVSSMMVLYREVAALGVPSASKLESWGDLKGKTLAVTGGTDVDDPLILTLLKLNGASDAKRVAIPIEKLPAEFLKGSVQAGAFIAPLTAGGVPGQHPPRAAWTRKNTPKFVDIEDAETLAGLDKRYEEATIPVGAFASAPALPSEQISTLGVRRHLVIRDNALSLFVRVVIADLTFARRALLGKFSELSEMGPPDLEAGAIVPVQQVAKAYYNGEESGILSQVENWLYYGPMLVGALMSLFAWIFRFVVKGQQAATQVDLLQQFVQIGIAGQRDSSQEVLVDLRVRFDALLDELAADPAPLTQTPENAMPLLAAIEFAGRNIGRQSTGS